MVACIVVSCNPEQKTSIDRVRPFVNKVRPLNEKMQDDAIHRKESDGKVFPGFCEECSMEEEGHCGSQSSTFSPISHVQRDAQPGCHANFEKKSCMGSDRPQAFGGYFQIFSEVFHEGIQTMVFPKRGQLFSLQKGPVQFGYSHPKEDEAERDGDASQGSRRISKHCQYAQDQDQQVMVLIQHVAAAKVQGCKTQSGDDGCDRTVLAESQETPNAGQNPYPDNDARMNRTKRQNRKLANANPRWIRQEKPGIFGNLHADKHIEEKPEDAPTTMPNARFCILAGTLSAAAQTAGMQVIGECRWDVVRKNHASYYNVSIFFFGFCYYYYYHIFIW